MSDKLLGDIFIDDVNSVLGALTHVGEFDMHSFLSGMFVVSNSTVDSDADDARTTAEAFIKESNRLTKLLMSYRPANANDPVDVGTWWRSRKHYDSACIHIEWLQNWVTVLSDLQASIKALSGPNYATKRQGLISFKKQAEDSINGLNVIIETYNRSVLPRHPDYKLEQIILPKK